ncbi:MAG TPA: ribonucleotide-diphosphate reductase subunit beta [Actinomycetota bacterium]|nr:ribonucleotide-diphosphate reductase subunit beta [Actinomycetota bacterium]
MSEDLLEKPEVISYDRLYRLWEQNNWSATAIDFSTDIDHWNNRFDERQREAALWNYAMFLVGEEAVARTLTPVLDAAPDHAQKLFLTTQIVDEARHHVFFDRFMREVAGKGSDPKSTLDAVESQLTWGFKKVFGELDRVTEELHKKPKDKALLAQTIALYHVIIEGVLAVPGQHFIQRYVKEFKLMPGFSEGINNVSRDEARHVAFGIKFLGELVRSSKELRDAAIEMWDRVLPWSAGVFIPPGRDKSYVECFGFSLVEIYAFGMRSFQTKLKRVGIDPSEIELLGREDLSRSYEERARRAWVLIDSQVIGDDRLEPKLSPEAYEIIFEGMAEAMNLDVARSLGGPVEWDFTDAEPWHLVVTNGHAEAKPGRAGKPALRLEAKSSEWAKFAVGRTDPRIALLKRKLKVHGSFSALTKLPKLVG